jgi:hypothetical protein
MKTFAFLLALSTMLTTYAQVVPIKKATPRPARVGTDTAVGRKFIAKSKPTDGPVRVQQLFKK